MSITNRALRTIAVCLGASTLAAGLVACSSSGSQPVTPGGPSPATLSGPFTFTVTGTDPSDGAYAVAGALTFDGAGKVTGVADYNLGSGIDENVPLSGTYTIAGRVALVTLTDGEGTQDTFSSSIAQLGSSPVSAFDGTGTGTLTAASGTAYAPAGTYTFSLSGQGDNTLTSTGGFVVKGNSITSGTETDTDGATVRSYTTLSGLVAPVQANGRGRAAIGGYSFGYYPITSNQIALVGLDDRALLSGTAQKQ